jgi:hypothetical protein
MTMRNFIQRKEGFRAEHFHSYGFLLVEIDAEGHWWPRHVELGPDDAMFDLDVRAKGGKVTTGHRPANVMWGDIHARRVSKTKAEAGWRGKGNLLDTLRPKSQHAHDLLDFEGNGHWTLKDPHQRYKMHCIGHDGVPEELSETAKVANEMVRPWCPLFVVDSNHDRHMVRMLKEVDWRSDMKNAEWILEFNLELLRAIRAGTNGKEFFLVEHALRKFGCDPTIRFLREDESHVICGDVGREHGIEAGIHGDRGVNGTKGTVAGIARIGRKVNMADKHGIERQDHVMCGGTSSELDLGYNKGLGSWSHADILTYENSTRTHIVYWKGKWRA